MAFHHDPDVHSEAEYGPYKIVEVRSIFEIADANTSRFQNFERRQGKVLKKEDFGSVRSEKTKSTSSRDSRPISPISPISIESEFERSMGIYFPEDKHDVDHGIISCQNIHEGPVEDFFDIFDTDPETGLCTAQVEINAKVYGQNILKTSSAENSSVFRSLFNSLFRPFTLIVWMCSILSGISYTVQLVTNYHAYSLIDNAIACLCLLCIAVLNTALNFLQEQNVFRNLRNLKDKSERTTTVLRNSKPRRVPNDKIVVGDIIQIYPGDVLPADIRIIQSHGLKVDESMFKGESKPRSRSCTCTHENPLETANLAFASTLVVEGSGTGIVLSTGGKTTVGGFIDLALQMPNKVPLLTCEIRCMVKFIMLMAFAFSLINVGCSFLLHTRPIKIFVDTVNIILSFMPVGLGLALTALFWRISKRVANNSSMTIKNPEALRSLGMTNVLCVDKTGTITRHRLSVTHLFFNNEILENNILEDKPDFEDKNVLDIICNPGFQALETVAILCNSAKYTMGKGSNCFDQRVLEGDHVDKALVTYFELYRTDTEYLRHQYELVYDEKFSPTRKFQACLYKKKEEASSPLKFDSFLFVMKGAPEEILRHCTSILVESQQYPLTEEWLWEVKKAQTYLASVGEILIGCCDLHFKHGYNNGLEASGNALSFNNMLRRGLRFVGLVSMLDPPRPRVRETIEKCKAAGIKVIMLTGDHADTSKAIAQSVGILSQGPCEAFPKRGKVSFGFAGSGSRNSKLDDSPNLNFRSVTSSIIYHGIQLYALSNHDLQLELQNHTEIVFARLNPQQKLTIVKQLQEMGNVVTMVGDGINDVAALKQADVGVAIGIEVDNSNINRVQDAADIIIQDGNFYGIVEGMELSRSCVAVIKRMFFYCMADSLPFVIAMLSFSILRIPVPISLAMVLITRISIDMMVALTIPSELDNFKCWVYDEDDPSKDLICSHSLISYIYGQLGMIQTLAGFATYLIIYAQNGFLPLKLLGIEKMWNCYQVNDLEDSYGQEWPYDKRKELETVGSLGFFMAIAVCQCANLFVCQSRLSGPFWRRSFGSYPLTIMALVVLAIAVSVVYMPLAVVPFYLERICFRFDWWFISIPFFFLIIVYNEVRHYFQCSPFFKSEFRF